MSVAELISFRTSRFLQRKNLWAYSKEFQEHLNDELVALEDLDPGSLSSLDRPIIVPQCLERPFDTDTANCIHCASEICIVKHDINEGQMVRCPFCLRPFRLFFCDFVEDKAIRKNQNLALSKVTIFQEHNEAGEVYYSILFRDPKRNEDKMSYSVAEGVLSKINTTEWRVAKNGKLYRVSNMGYKILYEGSGRRVRVIDVFLPWDLKECAKDLPYDEYWSCCKPASAEELGQQFPCEGY